MAVLVIKTEEFKNRACVEDGTAVDYILSTPDILGAMRATDRQTDRQTIVAQT